MYSIRILVKWLKIKGKQKCEFIIKSHIRKGVYDMNKKIFSILSILLVVMMFSVFMSPEVLAMPGAGELSQIGKDFIDRGEQSAKIDADQIAGILQPLSSLLLGIGIVVLVVVTGIMGIKYMAATPETRGKLKTQLIGIAVSAIVLFGAYGIWSLAYNIMNGLIQ